MPRVFDRLRWWVVQIDDEIQVIDANDSVSAVQSAMKRAAWAGRLPPRGLIGFEEVTDGRLTDDSRPCVEARVKASRRAGTPADQQRWGDKVARCDAARDRRREQWKREAKRARE